MMHSKIRTPVVAGQFYPASPTKLRAQLTAFVDMQAKASGAVACILPHAGYMYSGMVAGRTIAQVVVKDTVILLGPNHTGNGASFSIMTEGAWQTPLGDVPIAGDLAKKILEHSQYLQEDARAHEGEHSLEVELPFLQFFNKNVSIVPICLMSQDTEALAAIGREIAAVLERDKLRDSVLLVASSDMTHYESEHEARRKDTAAIHAICKLNEHRFTEIVRRFDVSMCGYAPAVVMIAAAKALGASGGRLAAYQTSGDVTGDRESVVGYAGIIIS